MMQASSHIFLGWSVGLRADRHYYWRQLRDMKGSLDVESIARFAERYADQNDKDFAAFTEAVRSGRIEAREGL
jgi:Uncharacterized protein conserved in bacteria (DUF2252)